MKPKLYLLTISLIIIILNQSFVNANDHIPYKNNLKELNQLAARGDDMAQAKLGIYYLSINDFPNAFKWFNLSVKKNNPHAQNGLGAMYQFGWLVKQDFTKANYWFKKSAIQNNSDSQFFLGENLYLGKGIKKDIRKAYKWTERAALNGSADAQYNLGAMLQNGHGCKKNIALAMVMYNIAAMNGSEKAINYMRSYNNEFKSNPKFKEAVDALTKDFIEKHPDVVINQK